jgi:hypothetical protein
MVNKLHSKIISLEPLSWAPKNPYIKFAIIEANDAIQTRLSAYLAGQPSKFRLANEQVLNRVLFVQSVTPNNALTFYVEQAKILDDQNVHFPKSFESRLKNALGGIYV